MHLRSLFMVPLLVLLAMFQSVVGPRLAILGVRPDLILLVVIVWTLWNGSREGVVWAFVGGVWMDVLSGGPMGGSSLALMAAALVAGIGTNRFFYSNPLVPLAAAALGTLTYALTYLGIVSATGHTLPFAETVGRLVLPSILYNTLLMFCLIPLLNRLPARKQLDSLG